MMNEFKKLTGVFLLVIMCCSINAFAGWGTGGCCEQQLCCDQPCDSCCWGAYVIYENVIVKPFFSRNNAYFLENPGGVDGQSAFMFDWEYKYSPRIEIGWVNNCGMGLRGRYWRFHNDTDLGVDSPAGEIATWYAEDSSNDIGFDNGTRAEFEHRLDMDVVDFETMFTQCFWTYSAGGRYTRIKQFYTAQEILPGTELIDENHRFEGGGITTAVEYLRPVWCGFSFFTKARGSLLYGNSNFLATNGNQDAAIRSKNENDVLAVGELQLGVDWRTKFCNFCTFFRFAIETQYWINGGSAGPGDNAVYDEGNYQNSNPQDSDLGFFGFNIAIGVNF